MTKYENKKFSNMTFVIEDCFFVNCQLSDCDLFFSGGDLEWVNTQFENCHWHFRGPALKTVQLQQMIGMLKAEPLPIPLLGNPEKSN
jgi:hypothetical protein